MTPKYKVAYGVNSSVDLSALMLSTTQPTNLIYLNVYNS